MNPGSPAAARSGRRTPPPATSSSGSGRCGRSPSRPRCCSSKCHLPILTYSSLPRRPARCCPRQPPIGRALQTNPEDPRAPSRAAPPAGDPPTGSATAPHRPAPPRIDSSGPRPRPPRGIGWPALLAAAGSDGRLAPAGLERPNPTGLLLFRVTSPSPRPRWCGAVWSRSRRAEKVRGRKTTEHLHRRRRRPALLEEEE